MRKKCELCIKVGRCQGVECQCGVPMWSASKVDKASQVASMSVSRVLPSKTWLPIGFHLSCHGDSLHFTSLHFTSLRFASLPFLNMAASQDIVFIYRRTNAKETKLIAIVLSPFLTTPESARKVSLHDGIQQPAENHFPTP